MDSKKSNKIREIVRLQQILKKWKKVANASKNSSSSVSSTNSSSSSKGSKGIKFSSSSKGSKGIKFLKRTLSFTDIMVSSSNDHNSNPVVPKGFLAVCVGKELKRFVIPTEYLSHQAFAMLLREAEDEFGFQQEGVLKIPCPVSVFEKILKLVEDKRSDQDLCFSSDNCEVTVTPSTSHHAQMCR